MRWKLVRVFRVGPLPRSNNSASSRWLWGGGRLGPGRSLRDGRTAVRPRRAVVAVGSCTRSCFRETCRAACLLERCSLGITFLPCTPPRLCLDARSVCGFAQTAESSTRRRTHGMALRATRGMTSARDINEYARATVLLEKRSHLVERCPRSERLNLSFWSRAVA